VVIRAKSEIDSIQSLRKANKNIRITENGRGHYKQNKEEIFKQSVVAQLDIYGRQFTLLRTENVRKM
jgi:hypothetical protein